MADNRTRRKPENFLGVVTAGSLAKGVQARIRTLTPLERIQTGQFVALECDGVRFFGLLTDVTLGATSDSVLLDPPYPQDGSSSLLREVLHGVYTYGDAHIQPSLALLEGETQPKPVRSVPSHFAPVFVAEEADFEQVFGAESIGQNGQKFAVGQPLDMNIDVCLDLERFVERSNGIFGKSGTGKSVLTRLLLSGLIRANTCSNLIFDMHNEYGSSTRGEYANQQIKGLRDLFGSRVMVYAVRDRKPGDRSRGEARATTADGDIVIGMNHIDVEDILLLRSELQLNATAAESAYILQNEYRDKWMATLLNMESEEIKEFCDRTGANRQSIDALKRKLTATIQRLPFVEEYHKNLHVVNEMVEALAAGRHVVVQFGGSDDLLSYMLVANIITRSIHKKYKELTERFKRTQNAADEPRRVMITIEEAHKFLTPEVAGQTIFGTIAREMRKYYVTLLVVDQRPSSIDSEVMSQIGTRIVALINDERDIDAVFTGVSGATGLKTVLASLDSRQQALLLGHASPMPVVIRTRPFDENFYRAITGGLSSVPAFVRPPSPNGNGYAPDDEDDSFADWASQQEAEEEARRQKDRADLFG